MTTLTEMADDHREQARCVGHDLRGSACPVRDSCQRYRDFTAEMAAGRREWPSLVAFPHNRPCPVYRRPTA